MVYQAIESLIGQEIDKEFSYEILVVDDASTDDTKEVIGKFSEWSHVPIRYIPAEGKGVACARNKGLTESSAEWVAFFDDDQLADPGWLNGLCNCALKTKARCVGGRRVLDLPKEHLLKLSKTSRNLLGEVNLGTVPRKCGRKEFPAAGNVLFERSVFDAVGGFDESLVRGGEDVELAQRLRSSGIGAWYTPGAVVRHMTPVYRLRREYLVWASKRAGDAFAYRDFLEWGGLKTVLACIARAGKALMVNVPLLAWSTLQKDEEGIVEQKCLLWRFAGYMFLILHVLNSNWFSNQFFFSPLEFRKERELFLSSINKSLKKSEH